MPHAEETTMSQKSSTMVNGDKPHSAFIDHLASYPIISHSIATYKSYPLGAQTIALASNGYARFVSPFITHPYAQETIKPRVAPYLSRADAMGDNGLATIDAHFPLVKKEPGELQGMVLRYARAPLELADEGKKHVLDVWAQEYRKCGGDGIVAGAKALVTTGLVATSETLTVVAGWLGKKKEEAKAKVDANGGAK